jgi:hypothetical protein
MEENGRLRIRKHKRIPFDKEVEIRGEGIFRGVEISVGGMYLKTEEPYPVGTVLDLQFKLSKTDGHPINIPGCVLYNQKRVGFGLGFLNISADNHQKLEEFIEQAS